MEWVIWDYIFLVLFLKELWETCWLSSNLLSKCVAFHYWNVSFQLFNFLTSLFLPIWVNIPRNWLGLVSCEILLSIEYSASLHDFPFSSLELKSLELLFIPLFKVLLSLVDISRRLYSPFYYLVYNIIGSDFLLSFDFAHIIREPRLVFGLLSFLRSYSLGHLSSEPVDKWFALSELVAPSQSRKCLW